MLFPAGTVLHNPVTAEWARVQHIDTSAVTAELVTAPGGGVPVMHRHPVQSERFDVLAGELTVTLEDQTFAYGPGATAVVPARAPHCWRSSGAESLYARITVSPTLRFPEMIATGWGLSALGRTRHDGGPRLLDAVLMSEAFGEELELCAPPRWLQRAGVALFAPIVRAGGRTITSPDVLTAAVVDTDRWPGPRPAAARRSR